MTAQHAKELLSDLIQDYALLNPAIYNPNTPIDVCYIINEITTFLRYKIEQKGKWVGQMAQQSTEGLNEDEVKKKIAAYHAARQEFLTLKVILSLLIYNQAYVEFLETEVQEMNRQLIDSKALLDTCLKTIDDDLEILKTTTKIISTFKKK